MSTASDEPPAPPRLPRAVSQATAPRARVARHARRALRIEKGDRRVYFASVEGEVWRYDALKDACDACWTSAYRPSSRHQGRRLPSLGVSIHGVVSRGLRLARTRVVGRQRRVGTGATARYSGTDRHAS